MIIGEIGLGLEIPRPRLSLRYRPMERSPRAKLTDDMDWMSSRLSLVVKNGRPASTSSSLGEGAFTWPPTREGFLGVRAVEADLLDQMTREVDLDPAPRKGSHSSKPWAEPTRPTGAVGRRCAPD